MLKIIQEDKKKENISKIKEICDNMGLPVFILGGGDLWKNCCKLFKEYGNISTYIIYRR